MHRMGICITYLCCNPFLLNRSVTTMRIEENYEKYGMAVPNYEARIDYEQLQLEKEVTHSQVGVIPKRAEIIPVRCPFCNFIRECEMKMPLCEHAEHCQLEDAMDLCNIPHFRDFESTGLHIKFEMTTVLNGFTVEIGVKRVTRHNVWARSLLRVGKVPMYPKTPRRKGPKKVVPDKPNTVTRAEAYSVFEYNTTPPKVQKIEIIMTRQERFETADRKESKRIQFIQDCRDLKIEEMLKD